MARIRTVKPEFFRDEKVLAVSFAARLLFIALWTAADREGRLLERPGQFRIDYFPTDRVDVPRLLEELEAQRLIVRWVADGVPYLAIPSFLRHQRPTVREAQSVIPPPPCPPAARHDPDSAEHDPDSAEHDPDSAEHDPDSAEHDPDRPRTQGREGKGREGKEILGATSRRSARRSRRTPADWQLSDAGRQYARERGMSEAIVAEQLEAMRDHEFRDPKLDWDATWRRWVRTWAERCGGAPPGAVRRAPTLPSLDEVQAREAEHLAALECEWAARRAAGGGGDGR